MLLLLAFSFNQAGINTDSTNQAVFLISLTLVMLIIPWNSIDIEKAFRNRSRTTPTAPFQFN
jgi:integral membrane sensor domain MASE1